MRKTLLNLGLAGLLLTGCGTPSQNKLHSAKQKQRKEFSVLDHLPVSEGKTTQAEFPHTRFLTTIHGRDFYVKQFDNKGLTNTLSFAFLPSDEAELVLDAKGRVLDARPTNSNYAASLFVPQLVSDGTNGIKTVIPLTMYGPNGIRANVLGSANKDSDLAIRSLTESDMAFNLKTFVPEVVGANGKQEKTPFYFPRLGTNSNSSTGYSVQNGESLNFYLMTKGNGTMPRIQPTGQVYLENFRGFYLPVRADIIQREQAERNKTLLNSRSTNAPVQSISGEVN